MYVSLPYDLNALGVSEKDFYHPTPVHGLGHSIRVSIISAIIGERLGHSREGQIAAMAALFHDMAREDDSENHLHGKRAAELIVPHFKDYIFSLGFSYNEFYSMQFAIEWHSYDKELESHHPMSLVTYILKDADALDRLRIKAFDSDYIRLIDSSVMVSLVKSFYRKILAELKIMLKHQEQISSVCQVIDNWIDSEDSFSCLLNNLSFLPKSTVQSIVFTLESPQLYNSVLNNK